MIRNYLFTKFFFFQKLFKEEMDIEQQKHVAIVISVIVMLFISSGKKNHLNA